MVEKRKKRKRKKPRTEQTDDYFDESGGFAHRLWYGGMLNFQIGNYDFNSTFLLIGVSPMVGYKLTDNFSIGPRATINYFEVYQQGPNIKVMELGIGGFGRAKFTPNIFAHVEYEALGLNDVGDIPIQESNESNFYAGIGYNSAGGAGFGYEIMALYNFLEENENIVPIEMRIGFTWNF